MIDAFVLSALYYCNSRYLGLEQADNGTLQLVSRSPFKQSQKCVNTSHQHSELAVGRILGLVQRLCSHFQSPEWPRGELLFSLRSPPRATLTLGMLQLTEARLHPASLGKGVGSSKVLQSWNKLASLVNLATTAHHKVPV